MHDLSRPGAWVMVGDNHHNSCSRSTQNRCSRYVQVLGRGRYERLVDERLRLGIIAKELTAPKTLTGAPIDSAQKNIGRR
jgi:hypothetical protein